MDNTPAPSPTPQRLMQLTWGFAVPLVLEAAVTHGVFDHLKDRGKTLEELARDTGTSLRGLRAILNVLVAFDLLSHQADRYALTPESAAFLVSDSPGYQGGILKHVSRQLIPQWLRLTDIVKTGTPPAAVNDEGHGSEFFSEFVEDIYPMSAMAAHTLAVHLASHAGMAPTVLDIAAGSGVWGIEIARVWTDAAVTAVDWPKVIPVTRRIAERNGVGDQFAYLRGDLLEVDFGSNFRLATLGHILHSEGVRRSRMLLMKVFAALAPGGTIAIAEFVPDDDRTGPAGPLIFAVNMLVNTTEGDTYTFAELRAWLEEAGFVDIRRLDAPGPSPLILADRPTHG